MKDKPFRSKRAILSKFSALESDQEEMKAHPALQLPLLTLEVNFYLNFRKIREAEEVASEVLNSKLLLLLKVRILW